MKEHHDFKMDWMKADDNQTQITGALKQSIQIIKNHKHKGIQLSVTFIK